MTIAKHRAVALVGLFGTGVAMALALATYWSDDANPREGPR